MASSPNPQTQADAQADPAVRAALAWIDAHSSTAARCVEQQELEAELLRQDALPPRADENAGNRAGNHCISKAFIKAKAAETEAAGREHELLDELAQVRSALKDLRHIMAGRAGDTSLGAEPNAWNADRFISDPQSLAAWLAFDAWSQGEEERYRLWVTAFKALAHLPGIQR